MVRNSPRIHRLPHQPRDYALIPAPLNITLPASEKSTMPSIIVTPSSPSTPESPFYIAFLAPPKKPSFRERIAAFAPSFQFKSRTTLVLLVLLLVVVFCHILAHRLAELSRQVDFGSSRVGLMGIDPSTHGEVAKSPFVEWLYSWTFWTSAGDDKHGIISSAWE